MEDKHVAFESSVNGEHESASVHVSNGNPDHGWQKVTYAKRQRKQIKPSPSDSVSNKIAPNGSITGEENVFRSLEQQAEDRRRRIVEAQKAANGSAVTVSVRSKLRSDDDEDDDSDADVPAENGKAEEAKKVKPKKPKKPKVTVAEAAAKIDANDLSAFLADVSGSFETQQDIQLMRFADYFGRAFSNVSSSQFPWVKIFRESTVAKLVDIPLSHISDAVYKTSVNWLGKRPIEALGSFVLWSLDSILLDLASQHVTAKSSKKGVQPVSSKSQVAIFAVVAMVLRRRPDVVVNLLPTLRDNSKYQGHEKLSVIVWMIVQACQGDLAVGMYAWAHYLLPIVGAKSCNPQSRDLVLQLVERILSGPKARSILVNGAVRKGERLISPSRFETLMRVTFPSASARVKATERFETIYLTLKEIALAGSPGSKAMKQVSQQIFNFAVKAAGENIPKFSEEATHVIIWSLTQNVDCYKQWDQVYLDNTEASISILKKLYENWNELSVKLSSDALKETLKSFTVKNEKALAREVDAATYKEADKYAKLTLRRLSRGRGCMKGLAFAVIALAVGAAVMSPNVESWDWKKLSVVFTPQQSF